MFNMNAFPDVAICDTEFATHPEGNPQQPLCVCAQGIRSGREVRYWVQGEGYFAPPFFLTQPDVLFVAFRAEAELKTFIALGWPSPRFVLDIYYLHRRMTNGYPGKRGLADCAKYHNLPLPYALDHKHALQQRAAAGGYFNNEEQAELLTYCAQDVNVTLDLFRVLCPDHPSLWKDALLYGEYLKVVAKEEHCGIPVDHPRITRLLAALPDITHYLVSTIPKETRFYDEEGHFSETEFEEYLIRHKIPWIPVKPHRKRAGRFDEPRISQNTRVKPSLEVKDFEEMGALPVFYSLLEATRFKAFSIGYFHTTKAMIAT